jgi:hypothetical protein
VSDKRCSLCPWATAFAGVWLSAGVVIGVCLAAKATMETAVLVVAFWIVIVALLGALVVWLGGRPDGSA